MSDKERIRFLKSAIKYKGKKARVWYSKGNYTPESKIPKETITITAKDYGDQLPVELNPVNETELMTDYFDKDRARIKPGNKYYKDVEKALIKQQDFNKKILEKRKLKYGW